MQKLVYFLAFILSTVSDTAAADEKPSFNPQLGQVSNWESEVKTHLGVDKKTLTGHKWMRCIMLNNYWCLKDVGWEGRLGHDSDSHTAFKNVFYAARGAVRNIRTAYYKHGRKSAFAIMSVYAPPDDCIGSNAYRRPDGTCIYGKNPTEKYARSVANGITEDINADLKLFDSEGKATDSLVKFLANMAAFEIGGVEGGFSISESTIRKGICLENSSCSP